MSNSTAITKIETLQITTIDAEIVVSDTTPATDYLGEFLAGKSAHTARNYRFAITQFLNWSNLSEYDFLVMSSHHAYRLVSAYQSQLQSSDLAANSILAKLAAIRSFKNWSFKGLDNSGGALPSLDNLPVSEPYKDTRGTSPEKMKEILSHLTDIQEKVIWGLLVRLGLRRSEISNINVGDINLSEGTILVKGKGKRDKTPLTLGKQLTGWIGELLAKRDGGTDTPLLQNRKNTRSDSKRLSTQSIYVMVKKWGEMVEVSGLRPHKVRHTAITAVLDGTGGNLHKAAKFSRHSRYDTLQHYDDNRVNFQKECVELLEKLI